MNSQDIQGLPIINRADGKRVGVIDELFLDRAATRIVGVSIQQETGLLGTPSSRRPSIAVAAFHTLLSDALTVNNVPRADAEWDVGDGVFVPLDAIVGNQVRTESGTESGEVVAVEVNERTFAVTQIVVGHGLLKAATTRIPRDRLLRVEPGAVIIRDDATPGG